MRNPPPWANTFPVLSTSSATIPGNAVVAEPGFVVVTPGRGYGERGEGFFRISLTVADARLDEALERIRKAFA